MLPPVGRIAFRADERLEQRLRDLTKALEGAKLLRHVDVTTSTAIKIALGYGLPFAERLYSSKTFGDGEETVASWLNSVYRYVLEMADMFDVELDPVGASPVPDPDVGDPDDLSK